MVLYIAIIIIMQIVRRKISQSGQELPNHIVAHIKLVVIFCAYGLAGFLISIVYSVALKTEDAYLVALHQYFDCEKTAFITNKTCDRSIFEDLDASVFLNPVGLVSYVFYPFPILLYVLNFKRIKFKKKADVEKSSAISENQTNNS